MHAAQAAVSLSLFLTTNKHKQQLRNWQPRPHRRSRSRVLSPSQIPSPPVALPSAASHSNSPPPSLPAVGPPPPAMDLSKTEKQASSVAAAALPEELVEEVLLRFAPDDPASLVRAALVSKRWCRLIAGRGFRRRFRELHRAAPMLGFICNIILQDHEETVTDGADGDALLVPTSSCTPPADHHGWRAMDSRYSRVLLCNVNCLVDLETCHIDPFVIWNPVTGEYLELPSLPPQRCTPPPRSFNATLLCAGGDACNHLDDDCHYGRFLVVFVGTYVDGLFTYVYSSDAGAWSEPSIVEDPNDLVDPLPAPLVGNAVYFLFSLSKRILKYDLVAHANSFLHMPASYDSTWIILMSTEKGKLGFVRADDDFKLYLWSMEVGPQGDALWTQDNVIELQNLLPTDALFTPPHVVGCVQGRGIVLVCTGDDSVVFAIDPNLNQATKVGENILLKDDYVDVGFINDVVSYTSFYFPALGAVSIAQEPTAGSSSA